MTTVLVVAKAPSAGRVKTRLCPPCTPQQAAALAEAALADTLAEVAATPVERKIVVLDGPPGPWLPAGFEVVAQRGGGLDERLAHAFADTVRGTGEDPALLIGMDTPQVSAAALAGAVDGLLAPGTDAVLGPAEDGGWWALGLRRPDPSAVLGVPMSSPSTGASQRRRLTDLGLAVRTIQSLRDVDTIDDARAVAAEIPGSRFARALAALEEVAGEAEPATRP